MGLYVSTIDWSGHDWSQEVCMSAPRSVDFVDVDIVDGGFGDGGVEAGEQLLEGFVLAPAEHGQGLAALGGDGNAADGFDVSDDDLAVLGELIDVWVHGDCEGRSVEGGRV